MLILLSYFRHAFEIDKTLLRLPRLGQHDYLDTEYQKCIKGSAPQ